MYKLYGRPGSGSLAVQVALEEAGATYEHLGGSRGREVERFRTSIQPAECPPWCFRRHRHVRVRGHADPSRRGPSRGRAGAANGKRRACEIPAVDGVSVGKRLRSGAANVYSARYSARGEADADAIREQGTADFAAIWRLSVKASHRMYWGRIFNRRYLPVHARLVASGQKSSFIRARRNWRHIRGRLRPVRRLQKSTQSTLNSYPPTAVVGCAFGAGAGDGRGIRAA
jgi:hypothetical protein